MNSLTEKELEQTCGGLWADGPLTSFGEQLAADGLKYADSSNPVIAALGLLIAAGGGWTWALGSAYDGLASLFD